jgi:hypothetical protein
MHVMSTIIRVPVIAVSMRIGTVIGKSAEVKTTLIGFFVPTGRADVAIKSESLGTVLRFVISMIFSFG